MIVRNLWLVVLLASVLLVITETSARNPLSINEHEHNVLKLSDVKGKKMKHRARVPASGQNLPEDLQGKKILLKVNEGDGGNEDDGGRFKRDAIELDEFKDAKKSYAKLKLAQTQSDLKKWKNKECGKYSDDRTTKKTDKRHANYYGARNKSKRYAATRYQRDNKTDNYYAQRKAVMERYYARQKEIAEKYSKKSSSAPKYSYTRNSATKTDTNNVSSPSKVEDNTREANNILHDDGTNSDLGTSTSVMAPEPITAKPESGNTTIDRTILPRQIKFVDDSSESSKDDDVFSHSSNYVSNDNDWVTDDNRIGTEKWGNCKGKLMYQHNLILNVHHSSSVEANLTTSLNGPFCVTCVRAIPMNLTQANMLFDVSTNENGDFSLVKVSMRSFQREELSYIIKIWATGKTNDVCEVQN